MNSTEVDMYGDLYDAGSEEIEKPRETSVRVKPKRSKLRELKSAVAAHCKTCAAANGKTTSECTNLGCPLWKHRRHQKKKFDLTTEVGIKNDDFLCKLIASAKLLKTIPSPVKPRRAGEWDNTPPGVKAFREIHPQPSPSITPASEPEQPMETLKTIGKEKNPKVEYVCFMRFDEVPVPAMFLRHLIRNCHGDRLCDLEDGFAACRYGAMQIVEEETGFKPVPKTEINKGY